MNWYTKRAALTGIYNTTELVMLQDSSPDFKDTWTFLDNRIQDVVNMASTAKQAKSDLSQNPFDIPVGIYASSLSPNIFFSRPSLLSRCSQLVKQSCRVSWELLSQ